MDRMGRNKQGKNSLAVSVAYMALYWPTPGFKGKTFKLCVLTRWDFNFCVRSSPLRGTNSAWCSYRQLVKKEAGFKTSIYFPTQSCYPISCYGNQWSGPMKSVLKWYHRSTPLVPRSIWSDRTTESENGPRGFDFSSKTRHGILIVHR